MDRHERNIYLLQNWMNTQTKIPDILKEQLESWLLGYEEHPEKLYQLYQKVCGIKDKTYTQQDMTLSVEQWKWVLSGAYELLLPILPLGSVVDLKKEILAKDIKELGQVERVRIVITQRYLAYTKQGYFTYAGVVYPVGRIKREEIIHFHGPMIQKVVHRGYEDEQETAYVSLMKQEYIVEQGMRSYMFAEEEECNKLIKYMEKMNVGRN